VKPLTIAAAFGLCLVAAGAVRAQADKQTPSYRRALDYVKDLNLSLAYGWLGDAIQESANQQQAARARVLRIAVAGAEATANVLLFRRYRAAADEASGETRAQYARWSQEAADRAIALAPMIATDVEGLRQLHSSVITFDVAFDPAKLAADEVPLSVEASDYDVLRGIRKLPRTSEQKATEERRCIAARLGTAVVELAFGPLDAADGASEWKRAVADAAAADVVLEMTISAALPDVLMHAGCVLSALADVATATGDASPYRYASLAAACLERALTLDSNPNSRRRALAQQRLAPLRKLLERAPSASVPDAASTPSGTPSAGSQPAPAMANIQRWMARLMSLNRPNASPWDLTAGKWTVAGGKLCWTVKLSNLGEKYASVAVVPHYRLAGAQTSGVTSKPARDKPVPVPAGSFTYVYGTLNLKPDERPGEVWVTAGDARAALTFDPNWKPPAPAP
jgi:hypothetical protein